MAYFIFTKNLDNLSGYLYKIAENLNDLNNLNINKLDYSIIEDTSDNFNFVKLSLKIVENVNDQIINYIDLREQGQDTIFFKDSESLQNYIDTVKKQIEPFLKNNLNHPYFQKWYDYYSQISNLDILNIQYPLKQTLEQYFENLSQPSLNTLQIP
jgi:hypothetical protein